MKWYKKDEELLKKKVKNYNAKISRLMKKGINEELLPSHETVKNIKEKIGNDREAYNREVKLLDVFLERYSMNTKKSNRGAVLPIWQEKQINIKLNTINKERGKERKKYEKIPKTDRNKKIDESNRFDNDNLARLKDRKFNFKNMSEKELKYFTESLKNYSDKMEEKNELYRTNYYKALEKKLSPEQFEKIKEILDKIPTDVIIMKYYTSLNMDIDFPYEPQEQDLIFTVILDSWKEVANKQ